MQKLEPGFYLRNDVIQVARDLIGKILVTNFDGIKTSGRIVETEAYNGILDKASHAFGGRRTNRTKVMYMRGSTTYVYLCYGIHHLFNVVTNVENEPHAVLIRAVEPIEGIATMLQRTGKLMADYSLTKGPGNVSRALGINTQHTALSLLGDRIYVAIDDYAAQHLPIIAGPRIGVDYAGEDAKLPFRFHLAGNPYVSGKSIAGNREVPPGKCFGAD